MKIAYFIDTLPPHCDGVVKTICQLVETLKTEKVEFKFFSSFKPGCEYNWTDCVHKTFSVPVAVNKEYRLALPYFQGVYKELDTFGPDIVHSVGPTFLSLYGSRYARKRNVKSVASYHTNFISYMPYYKFPRFLDPLAIRLHRRFYNRFDRVLVPSATAGEDLKKTGIRNIFIWSRGVNLDKYSPAHRNFELRKKFGADRQPLLLFVGRLVEEKDLKDLVSAVNLLKEKGHAFQLVIVGNGPMQSELQRLLPDAFFAGFQTGQSLSEWYASSDMLIFPSTTETFGNVVLEAFASGIPAVVVNKGGAKDLIREGIDGFIAESNSPKDLAGKIELALGNKNTLLQMGKEARKKAEKQTWERANRAVLKCYEEVLLDI